MEIILDVLVNCEESQEVTKAFRELGHNAFSCDLQECSGGHPEWHIQGDAIEEAYIGKYDLMIAHPPCTFLSNAGARWMYQPAGVLNNKRYMHAMKGKSFFMELWNAPIEYKGLENPLPLKVVGLPTPSQIIHPYEYGHPYSKKTLLWLNNLPNLIPTNIVDEYKPYMPSNTGGGKRGQNYMFKNISKKDSSKTFSGIAKAMAEQWSKHIIEQKLNLSKAV